MSVMQLQRQSSSQSVWQLDTEHSSVEFAVRKLLFLSVTGRLTKLKGSIVMDEDSVGACSVEATMESASIDTGNKRRDAHLRAAFLDVTNHPDIHFRSLEVGRGKDRDMLIVRGDLSIRDRNKEVVLDVTEIDRSRSPNGEEVIYYVAETELDRFDFGVTAWRGVVGSKLKVVINVQANRV
ncbi:MAG TPA: YceI family protein [Pyrinomonadaceae bacterium]|nr:YceI family protein [Pyrinomonadaceae bacterium]